MTDNPRLQGEYTILSYLVTCAVRTRELVRRAAVCEDMFTDAACRATFLALVAETSVDDQALLFVAARTLPRLSGAGAKAEINWFLDLSANPGALEYELVRFVESSIMYSHAVQLNNLLRQSVGMPSDLVFSRTGQIEAEAKARITALYAAFPDAGFATGISTIVPPPRQGADSAGGEPPADESILHMPGFVDELVEHSMRAAHHPNRTLSFAGALALLAHLAGRKFVGPNDARPNIYLIALADSGTGKDAPRTFNRNIAQYLRMEVSVQNTIASGQGLEDALMRTPTLLCQMDEFDTVLNMLKDERGNKQTNEALWNMILTAFTSSNSNCSTRLRAANQRGDGGGKVIYNPSLSIFATAIPGRFYAALSERALTNGFLARCLVFESGARGRRNPSSGFSIGQLPDSLLRKCSLLAGMGRRFDDNMAVDRRDLTEVTLAPGAAEEVDKVDADSDALYEKARRAGDDMSKSVWCRSVELVMKLSLLYAISESIGEAYGFSISPEAVRWAWRLVKSLQLRMLAMAEEHTATSQTDRDMRTFLALVRNAGKKGLTRSKLLTHMKSLRAKEIDEIEDTLLERGDIIVRELPRSKNGKQAKLYIYTGSND